MADPDNDMATDMGTVTNGHLRKYEADIEISTIIGRNDKIDLDCGLGILSCLTAINDPKINK